MSDSTPKIEDIPPEILRQQFEEILLVTLKEFHNVIQNHDDRIEKLEQRDRGC